MASLTALSEAKEAFRLSRTSAEAPPSPLGYQSSFGTHGLMKHGPASAQPSFNTAPSSISSVPRPSPGGLKGTPSLSTRSVSPAASRVSAAIAVDAKSMETLIHARANFLAVPSSTHQSGQGRGAAVRALSARTLEQGTAVGGVGGPPGNSTAFSEAYSDQMLLRAERQRTYLDASAGVARELEAQALVANRRLGDDNAKSAPPSAATHRDPHSTAGTLRPGDATHTVSFEHVRDAADSLSRIAADFSAPSVPGTADPSVIVTRAADSGRPTAGDEQRLATVRSLRRDVDGLARALLAAFPAPLFADLFQGETPSDPLGTDLSAPVAPLPPPPPSEWLAKLQREQADEVDRAASVARLDSAVQGMAQRHATHALPVLARKAAAVQQQREENAAREALRIEHEKAVDGRRKSGAKGDLVMGDSMFNLSPEATADIGGAEYAGVRRGDALVVRGAATSPSPTAAHPQPASKAPDGLKHIQCQAMLSYIMQVAPRLHKDNEERKLVKAKARAAQKATNAAPATIEKQTSAMFVPGGGSVPGIAAAQAFLNTSAAQAQNASAASAQTAGEDPKAKPSEASSKGAQGGRRSGSGSGSHSRRQPPSVGFDETSLDETLLTVGSAGGAARRSAAAAAETAQKEQRERQEAQRLAETAAPPQADETSGATSSVDLAPTGFTTTGNTGLPPIDLQGRRSPDPQSGNTAGHHGADDVVAPTGPGREGTSRSASRSTVRTPRVVERTEPGKGFFSCFS